MLRRTIAAPPVFALRMSEGSGMAERRSEDPELIMDALAYVSELYRELTEENGTPPLGTQNQVVEFILADPELSACVRRWAAGRREDDPVPRPPERLPRDPAYERVAARLRESMEPPIFEHPRRNPP